MHNWGDEWFEKNGDDLYSAIKYIEDYLHEHHIGVCGKEKYGTYRDEYLRFWDGGLYQLLFGYRLCIRSYRKYKWEWLSEFVDKIHSFIYFKIDHGSVSRRKNETIEEHGKRYANRKWKGLSHINTKIGLTKLINDIQAKHYNIAFQNACKKWPNVTTELIVMTEGYQMIKPGKYGDVDGQKIHDKFWTTVE